MATHSNTLAWKMPWTEEPDPKSFAFSPMLPSRCLIVLPFKIWFVMHCEIFFFNGVRLMSRFIFTHVDTQFFQHHLLKNYLCCFSLPLLLCESIFGFSILFHWFIFLFFHQYLTASITVSDLQFCSPSIQCWLF